MYKLLIIEDDGIEREALADFIDWKALGIELAGNAESAEEAINLSLTTYYDILLTNIRLPGMSGMEIARMMLQHQPRLKVIINGSLDDFDRAQQTGEIRSCSYINKPVDMGELKAVVGRVVREMNEERALAQSPERLKLLVQTNLPLIRRHFFERLVAGTLSDAEILKSLDYFGMGSMQGRYAMLLCELDGFDRQAMSQGWEGLQMMLEAVREAVLNLKLDGLLDFYYIDRGRFGALFCVSACEKKNEIRHVFAAAERIRNEAALFCGGSVTVGTGCTVSRLRDLKQSYQSAALALAYKSAAGRGQVVSHADIPFVEFDSGTVDLSALEEALVLAVQMANSADARNHIDRLFNSAKRKGWDLGRVYAACVRLLSRLLILLHDLGETDVKAFAGGAIWVRLQECRTIAEMQSIMDQCVAAIVTQLLERRAAADHEVVQRILGYISDHLGNRITAADLADEFSYSPNYIGMAFKKDTGKSLNDYLKDMRLEKARELLRNPANRIGEVAIKVGYPNVSNFCALFKKKYSVNPSEYRENA